MNVKRLIRREILHRKLNFALGLLAITAAVALFVAFFSAGQASKLETIRLMRDIGFNLRVIPAGTNMDRFWISGFSEQIMPERYVQDLAAFPGISYNHLTAPPCRERYSGGIMKSSLPGWARRSSHRERAAPR